MTRNNCGATPQEMQLKLRKAITTAMKRVVKIAGTIPDSGMVSEGYPQTCTNALSKECTKLETPVEVMLVGERLSTLLAKGKSAARRKAQSLASAADALKTCISDHAGAVRAVAVNHWHLLEMHKCAYGAMLVDGRIGLLRPEPSRHVRPGMVLAVPAGQENPDSGVVMYTEQTVLMPPAMRQELATSRSHHALRKMCGRYEEQAEISPTDVERQLMARVANRLCAVHWNDHGEDRYRQLFVQYSLSAFGNILAQIEIGRQECRSIEQDIRACKERLQPLKGGLEEPTISAQLAWLQQFAA